MSDGTEHEENIRADAADDRERDDLVSEDPSLFGVPPAFGTDVIEEADRSTRRSDPELEIET